MDLLIPRILPHTDQENMNIFRLPPQDPCEKGQGESFQTIQRVGQIPQPQRLVLLVSRPRIRRPLERFVPYVDETCFLHPFRVLGWVVEVLMNAFRGLKHEG